MRGEERRGLEGKEREEEVERGREREKRRGVGLELGWGGTETGKRRDC